MIEAVAASPALSPRDIARADAAAKEFEAVFVAQMLAPMFASVDTPAIAGGGKSEDFLKSLLQEQYAKAVTERGGFGIAASVKASLLDIQARASQSRASQSTETRR